MSTPATGTLTASGTYSYTITTADCQGIVVFSGTYSSATVTVEGAANATDSSPNWKKLRAQRYDTGEDVTSWPLLIGNTTGSETVQLFLPNTSFLNGIRLTLNTISGGTSISYRVQTATYFSITPASQGSIYGVPAPDGEDDDVDPEDMPLGGIAYLDDDGTFDRVRGQNGALYASDRLTHDRLDELILLMTQMLERT